MEPDQYDNPLVRRYASAEMSRIWSPQRKFSTWRRLWVALAEAQQELGLPIRDDQLAEMRAHVDEVDFAAAAQYERQLRHDVDDSCPVGPDGRRAHTHDYAEGGCRQVKDCELTANLGWATPGTGSAMVMARGG